MPETGSANIEVAHHLNETGVRHSVEHSEERIEILEIFETIVLALVAIATAWGGYQAARWDGQQSRLYGQSNSIRVQAQGLAAEVNDIRMYDAMTVAEWLKAEAQGDTRLAEIFERRLWPDFRPAFEAWKKTDPVHNPNAPAGPTVMPEYRDVAMEQPEKLNQKAAALFEEGTEARERADQYVRVTVVLATVLLLTAVGQRFRTVRIRAGLIILAFLLLIGPLWRILMLPRI